MSGIGDYRVGSFPMMTIGRVPELDLPSMIHRKKPVQWCIVCCPIAVGELIARVSTRSWIYPDIK